LSEQLIDNSFDRIAAPYFMAALLAVLAVAEWVRYFLNTPPSPWLYTSIAVIGAGWATLKIRRGMSEARAIRQGRDGERAVAQYLEGFRGLGFHTFHDVPNGDSNIDHVLIGTRGVYTIETKTLSKPTRGACSITVSSAGIQANGRTLDRNPLVQAKAQARWLHSFFAESEFKVFVQPVVVFPGWFVEKFDMKAIGVWVLEPKSLKAFFEQEPEAIPPIKQRPWHWLCPATCGRKTQRRDLHWSRRDLEARA
jgi:hypothetical protein